MNVDIGGILSTTLSMIRQRIWPILGLWAIFFAISLVFSTVFGALLGASLTGAAMMAGGLDDPVAMGGAGLMTIISALIFYVLYLAIAFAQQASMTQMASPIEKPLLGDAMVSGFKAGLTFVVLMILFVFIYMVFGLLGALVVAGLAMITEALALVVGLALLPVAIYLVCRLALIMPVVAVEKVYNPIKAINRTWAVSSGKVLGIFIVLVINVLSALIIVALPMVLVIGSTVGFAALDDPSAGAGAIAGVLFAFLLAIPLFLIYQVFSVALTACLHAEVSDDHIEQVSEMFE